MGKPWFKPWGWFYLPVSWPGLVALLVLFAFWVQVFAAIDRNSHSVSDTLYGVFPYFVCSFLLLDWVARHTSGKTK